MFVNQTKICKFFSFFAILAFLSTLGGHDIVVFASDKKQPDSELLNAAQVWSLPNSIAAGELDPAFGDGGLITATMYRNSYGSASALQSDGKIVVAGYVFVSTNSPQLNFGLARYNTDGSLDTTFGDNGKVITDFNATTDYGYSLAVQVDGKIILAGSYTTGFYGYHYALLRYNADGSQDTTFGINGKITIDPDLGGGDCYDIVLQADGKIVAVGSAWDGLSDPSIGISLVRFKTDGSLDTAFGNNGIVTTYVDGYKVNGKAIALQSNGHIVVAGQASVGGESMFALARYNVNGSLDTTFGTNGIQIVDFGIGFEAAWAVTIQSSDQKIIVVGYAMANNSSDFLIARFNTNGGLDTGFGSGGRVITDFGVYDEAHAVQVQPDGKIVVAGNAQGNFGLARYNPNGSLDTAFGVGGKVITDFGAGYDESYSVVLQPDGKIVLTGSASNGHNDNFALARYVDNGALDSAFGSGGKVITTFGGGFNYDYAAALQDDGKMIMAGASSNGKFFDVALMRFNVDGSLDSGFGYQGNVFTSISVHGLDDIGYAVAVQPDGKIVVAGTIDNPYPQNMDFLLVRYNSDGTLDDTFGVNGSVITDINNWLDYGRGLAILPDGKILVAGSSNISNADNDYDFTVVRYNSDGSLDTLFGSNGIVTTDIVGDHNDLAYAIALQNDTKIILVGASAISSTWSGYDFTVVRYNNDGGLDTSFGSDGKVTTDFGGEDNARAVAVQSDGKIVVTGDSDGVPVTVRYNTDGSLDTTFIENSGASIKFTRDNNAVSNLTGNDHNRSIVIQADGRILVSGDSNGDFALTRYNKDGSLDATYGTNGRVITDFGGNDDSGQAMVLQTDNKVILTGYTNKNNNYDFAGARYFTSEGNVMTFSDVSEIYWAWQYIERLYSAGITGGCSTSPLMYCPERQVTRAQMAVFLEKGLHYPSSYTAPNVAPTFTDTIGHWAEDWIEALKSDGVTAGCAIGLYCPENPVTRAQMAAFLLKSKYGSSYVPPVVGGSTGFGDVPTTHWAAAWIKQLAAEGITGGCGGGNYCPENPVTRAQMAVFLVKAFGLP